MAKRIFETGLLEDGEKIFKDMPQRVTADDVLRLWWHTAEPDECPQEPFHEEWKEVLRVASEIDKADDSFRQREAQFVTKINECLRVAATRVFQFTVKPFGEDFDDLVRKISKYAKLDKTTEEDETALKESLDDIMELIPPASKLEGLQPYCRGAFSFSRVESELEWWRTMCEAFTGFLDILSKRSDTPAGESGALCQTQAALYEWLRREPVNTDMVTEGFISKATLNDFWQIAKTMVAAEIKKTLAFLFTSWEHKDTLSQWVDFVEKRTGEGDEDWEGQTPDDVKDIDYESAYFTEMSLKAKQFLNSCLPLWPVEGPADPVFVDCVVKSILVQCAPMVATCMCRWSSQTLTDTDVQEHANAWVSIQKSLSDFADGLDACTATARCQDKFSVKAFLAGVRSAAGRGLETMSSAILAKMKTILEQLDALSSTGVLKGLCENVDEGVLNKVKAGRLFTKLCQDKSVGKMADTFRTWRDAFHKHEMLCALEFTCPEEHTKCKEELVARASVHKSLVNTVTGMIELWRSVDAGKHETRASICSRAAAAFEGGEINGTILQLLRQAAKGRLPYHSEGAVPGAAPAAK